jgi:hypothetical protein
VTVDGPEIDRPAGAAARIVGDHSMSRPVATRRFQRSTRSSASRRAARQPSARRSWRIRAIGALITSLCGSIQTDGTAYEPEARRVNSAKKSPAVVGRGELKNESWHALKSGTPTTVPPHQRKSPARRRSELVSDEPQVGVSVCYRGLPPAITTTAKPRAAPA